MRHLLFLIIMSVTLSACALGTQPASEIELTTIPLEDTEELFGNLANIEAESTATPTPFSQPTSTPLHPMPTPTFTPPPANFRPVSNCATRTDLPIYIVAAGDTLSNIARRYASSIEQLMTFNCLSNANVITVGMQLHVPVAATVTPTLVRDSTAVPIASPTRLNLGVRGTLGVFPVIQAGNPSNWSDYVIEAQMPITINWTDIEPEIHNQLTYAEFFYTPDTGSGERIGQDNNIADGIAITWTPPADVSGTITARTYLNNGNSYESSRLHLREPNEELDPCQFEFTSTGSVYDTPTTTATRVGSDLTSGAVHLVFERVGTQEGVFVQISVYGLLAWTLEANGTIFGNCGF